MSSSFYSQDLNQGDSQIVLSDMPAFPKLQHMYHWWYVTSLVEHRQIYFELCLLICIRKIHNQHIKPVVSRISLLRMKLKQITTLHLRQPQEKYRVNSTGGQFGSIYLKQKYKQSMTLQFNFQEATLDKLIYARARAHARAGTYTHTNVPVSYFVIAKRENSLNQLSQKKRVRCDTNHMMALHTAITKDELNLHLAKTTCTDLKNTVKRRKQIAELNIPFVLNTQYFQ